MRPYSLSLYTNVLDPGHGFVASLTNAAPDWKRTVDAIGGSLEGSFTLNPAAVSPTGAAPTHFTAFDTWLGYHLVEKYGGLTTFEGMITELELWHQGTRRIRTLALMANAVRATYTALVWQIGGGFTYQTRWTSWAVNAQSIAQYGRREQQLQLDACPQLTAEAKRDTTLGIFAWPWPRAIGSVSDTTTRLYVQVAGYLSTAAWMFVQTGDNLDHDVSHWIAAIIGTAFGLSSKHGGAVAGAGDCQFLKTGTIDTNTLQVTETTISPQRAGNLLVELCELGDSTAKPWQLTTNPGRTVDYHQLDTTPRYYIRRGQVYDSLTAGTPTPPWTLRPAVIRDMTYPKPSRVERGSFLSDPRDIYVEQIEATAAGQVSLRTSLFDKYDLLANQMDYLVPPKHRGYK